MEKDFRPGGAAAGQNALINAFARPLALPRRETGDASDSWFVVYKLKDNLFAIHEPRYLQRNYSYLVIGREQALMIDASACAGNDIRRVIKALTDKPCAVLPTHLHHDHLGGLLEFEQIWLADTPALAGFKRADGRYHLPEAYICGGMRHFKPPPFKVDRLIADNDAIDLGGVRLKAVHAPGHSQDDLIILDQGANILFVGDYMYPGYLICGNARAYAASAERLLALTNAGTLLLSAHASYPPRAAVPVMAASDLADLKNFLPRLLSREIESKIFKSPRYYIASARCYAVNEKMFFLDDMIWNDGSRYGF